MEDTLHPVTSYISRVIPLPLAETAAALEALSLERQWRSPRAPHWSVHLGPVSLRLDDLPAVDGDGARRCRGWLRHGRLTRSRVELELQGWSAVRSELGVRLLRPRATEPLLAAGFRVADAIAADIELRGLLATHPLHDAGLVERDPSPV